MSEWMQIQISLCLPGFYLSCVRLLAPMSWHECWIPAKRYGTNLWMEPLSCTAPETPWATLILSHSLWGGEVGGKRWVTKSVHFKCQCDATLWRKIWTIISWINLNTLSFWHSFPSPCVCKIKIKHSYWVKCLPLFFSNGIITSYHQPMRKLSPTHLKPLKTEKGRCVVIWEKLANAWLKACWRDKVILCRREPAFFFLLFQGTNETLGLVWFNLQMFSHF